MPNWKALTNTAAEVEDKEIVANLLHAELVAPTAGKKREEHGQSNRPKAHGGRDGRCDQNASAEKQQLDEQRNSNHARQHL